MNTYTITLGTKENPLSVGKPEPSSVAQIMIGYGMEGLAIEYTINDKDGASKTLKQMFDEIAESGMAALNVSTYVPITGTVSSSIMNNSFFIAAHTKIGDAPAIFTASYVADFQFENQISSTLCAQDVKCAFSSPDGSAVVLMLNLYNIE